MHMCVLVYACLCACVCVCACMCVCRKTSTGGIWEAGVGKVTGGQGCTMGVKEKGHRQT